MELDLCPLTLKASATAVEKERGEMTFWKADDRQGVKLFIERPTFDTIHCIYIGKKARRQPRKGDRVISKFIHIRWERP